MPYQNGGYTCEFDLPAVYVYTATRVLFHVAWEGQLTLHAVPRHPGPRAPEHGGELFSPETLLE
jgi:hypothetical protein